MQILQFKKTSFSNKILWGKNYQNCKIQCIVVLQCKKDIFSRKMEEKSEKHSDIEQMEK